MSDDQAAVPRHRGGWRLVLAALLGTVAGATLCPRPAKGQKKRKP
ncbi:MAG: hypothetical protein PGN25_17775 [Methylorubrum populi]